MFERLLQLLRRIIGPSANGPPLSSRHFPPSSHPLRPALDQRYLAMKDAMAQRDSAGIAALLTTDFVSIDVHGRRGSAAELISSVIDLDIDRSKRVATTTLVDIEEQGNQATVLQHYSMTSSPDAPPSMPRLLQTLSVDTWRADQGCWRLARTETREIEVKNANGVRRQLRARGVARRLGPDSLEMRYSSRR